MIQKNKVTTYLLYAIGEIFLVVVGILIAVQIDNWNVNRKQSENLSKVLLEIKANLGNDIIYMDTAGYYLNTYLQSNEFVLSHLNGESVNTDSIGFHYSKIFGGGRIEINKVGYERMKSIGIDLLDNEELKTAIVNFYENRLAMIEEQSATDEQFINTHLITQIVENVTSADNTFYKEAYPVDYESLSKNLKFREVLILNIGFKESAIQLVEITIPDMERIIALIDDYLTNK